MYNYSKNLSYRDPRCPSAFPTDETIYRKELLECFQMTEYSDDINVKIAALYELVKEEYVDIIELIRKNNPLAIVTALDDVTCFTFLFAWEYFYENHQLLGAIHDKSEIKTKQNSLIAKIEYINMEKN